MEVILGCLNTLFKLWRLGRSTRIQRFTSNMHMINKGEHLSGDRSCPRSAQVNLAIMNAKNPTDSLNRSQIFV